ncbi:MAG: phage holin family protein, partial [Jiangellales bacterium]
LAVPAAADRRRWARITARNWRLFVVRFFVAGLSVVLTVVVVPGLGFDGWRLGQFAVIGLVYGLLSALVKPALEFLALRFLVATYGFVVVLVNALLLYLLAWILPTVLVYDRVWQLLLGGLVAGAVGMFLETVLGATQPVLDRPAKGESPS